MRRTTAGAAIVLLLGGCASGTSTGGDAGASSAAASLPTVDLDRGADLLATCDVVGGAADDDRDHEDPESAPPADVMYEAHEERPAHSGPHFGVWELPSAVDAGSLGDFDERSLVHNLEHGSIVVAVDPGHPDAPDGAEVAAWAEALVSAGFASGRAGGGVYAVTYEGIASGAPVAYRAWGVALDCAGFDQDAASAFVATHYGTKGDAPEKTLSPYPDDVLDDTSPQA